MAEFYQMAAQGWPSNLFAWKATIANGASVTEMIPVQGKALVGVLMPASWTAAALGFKVSLNGSPRSADLVPVYTNNGTPMTTAALTAATFVPFPALDAFFGPFIQIASVTANTTTGVAQGAERTLILLFRNYLD